MKCTSRIIRINKIHVKLNVFLVQWYVAPMSLVKLSKWYCLNNVYSVIFCAEVSLRRLRDIYPICKQQQQIVLLRNTIFCSSQFLKLQIEVLSVETPCSHAGRWIAAYNITRVTIQEPISRQWSPRRRHRTLDSWVLVNTTISEFIRTYSRS
jgi:hypothetical protein